MQLHAGNNGYAFFFCLHSRTKCAMAEIRVSECRVRAHLGPAALSALRPLPRVKRTSSDPRRSDL